MSAFENSVCVTIDIDWAADFMIDQVAEILAEHTIPCTWFCTHATPALARLRARSELFELGIHPNFLPGSTHGEDMDAVLSHCLKIVPEAVSSRSHAVVQSGRLLSHLLSQTPIRNECSTFLPEMGGVYPLRHQLQSGVLTRLPFIWADDYHLCKQTPAWSASSLVQSPGLKVLTFHPVHIYLNSPSLAFYDEMRPLVSSGTQDQIAANTYKGDGIGTLFRNLCRRLGTAGSDLILSRIADLNLCADTGQIKPPTL